MAAGLSDDQHDEEEAELQSARPTGEMRPQSSDQVGEALALGQAEVDVLTWPLSLFRRETFITVPSVPPQTQEEEEAARGTPTRLACVQGDGGD